MALCLGHHLLGDHQNIARLQRQWRCCRCLLDQGCQIHARRHYGNTGKTNDTKFCKAHETRSYV